jgi:hypothetical protein
MTADTLSSALPPLAREITAAVLNWFYTTEQHAGALLACNGPHAITGDIEWWAAPRREFGTGAPLWPVFGMCTPVWSDKPDPRLPEGAEEAFLALVTELAGPPRCVHRCEPRPDYNVHGVTVELRRQMHPSLQKAVKNWDNYRCPLPEHDDWWPARCRDSGTCPWGEQAQWTIYPAWPAGVDSSGLG